MAEQLDAEDLRNLAIINANRHQLDPESQRMLDGIVAQAGAPEYGPATLPTRGAAPRKRGDVYDQLAKRRGGSIPARTGPVKPVSPDEIKFDDPKTRNGGFWGGVASSLNPIPMVDSMLDHTANLTIMGGRATGTTGVDPTTGMSWEERTTQRGDAPTTLDAVKHGVQATPFPQRLPFDIADTARESARRGAANESTSDMYGNVAGGVAQGLALDGIVRNAPAIRRASSSTARGLRKSALGTTEAHFERGAQPDLAAGETGVSLTRGQQFEKTQAGKQSAMVAKDTLLDHPSNASRTIDVDTPLDNAVRDFESNNIADLDPTTGTATVQTSLEARKFINGYKQKVNELTGGNPPTPRQADTLRRWVDDHSTSFDQATPGSVRSLAQNVRNGLNENLVANVEGLGAANKRIQSFIAAEDAARSTFYGGKSPTPVELLMRKGGAFIPTTAIKTGTATMLEKLGGSPSWDAVASVPTRRSIPSAATRGSTSTNVNTSPLGVADQAITDQLVEGLTQQAGKSQARNADVPRRGDSPIDAVRSAAIRDAESKGVGITVPTRPSSSHAPRTPQDLYHFTSDVDRALTQPRRGSSAMGQGFGPAEGDLVGTFLTESPDTLHEVYGPNITKSAEKAVGKGTKAGVVRGRLADDAKVLDSYGDSNKAFSQLRNEFEQSGSVEKFGTPEYKKAFTDFVRSKGYGFKNTYISGGHPEVVVLNEDKLKISPLDDSTSVPQRGVSVSSTTSEPSIEVGTEVHFGQQRQHGEVIGPEPRSKVPAVRVKTRGGKTHSVPISSLTILSRPK